MKKQGNSRKKCRDLYGNKINYIYGQTPLEPEELDELRVKTITNRGELDELEQQNIETAQEWIMSRTFSVDKILSEDFILNLHERMLGDVWSWAGKIRTSNKDIEFEASAFKYVTHPAKTSSFVKGLFGNYE